MHAFGHLAGDLLQRDHQTVTLATGTRWAALIVLACAVASVSSACSGTAAQTRPSPWWAALQRPGAVQADAFRRVPGSSSYRCVRVGHDRDVRSGSFLAGNFGADEQGFAADYQQNGRRADVKIYWVPLHVDHMPELTVQATLLPARTMTRKVRQSQVAANPGEVFYPSGIPIPVPGTWELVAKAGRNQGCFIATFTAAAS